MLYLNGQRLRFLRRVVGLTASPAQLHEILNAPSTNVYNVEFILRRAPWVVRPPVAKPKAGWPAGRKRSASDRLTPRSGRPMSIKSV